MENVLFTYFILFLTFGWGHGRVVRVPKGPLVRVAGQTVSIRCKVSNYEGPRQQDFDWNVVRDGEAIQLISTFDPAYSDRSLQGRVDSGDIAVEQVADDTAELRIRNLKSTDSATYRCSTPSTDSVISGNYEDEVRLKVIADSLKVSAGAPPATVPEGGPIPLRCTATLDPAEPAYLSITWSVRRGPASQEILTFGPEPGVAVDPASRQRYADGGLRLDFQGGGAYGLELTEAEPGDQGVYVCTAKQWVLERGGAWQEVLRRSVDMGEVQVTPTSQSLTAAVEGDRTLNVDETLNLTCTVAAEGLGDLGLDVAWLVSPAPGGGPTDSRVLAHIDQDGVVADPSDQVALSRVGTGVFRLLVGGVDRSSSGQYSCRVGAWIRRTNGEWYRAAEKTSNSAAVLVTAMEPTFDVTLRTAVTPQASRDPTELECQVTGVSHLQDGRLGVSWSYSETTPADLPISTRLIAALDQQGDLEAGQEYRQRVEQGLLVLSRTKPHTFKLRLLHTLDSDRGQYTCTVTAWTHQRDGSWAKVKEVAAKPISISWSRKPPSLSVSALPLRDATSAGSTFEMSCQATAQNLPDPAYSVLIRVQEGAAGGGGKARKILSLGPDAVLKLEDWDELGRLDSVVLEKTGPARFRFRLYGAQVTDRGLYSCEVTAWTPGPGGTWTDPVSAESNRVQISFADTGPAFNVSIQPLVSSLLPGQTALIECVVTALGASPKAGDVSYEVRWYQSGLLSLNRPALLVSLDRWGVVRKSLLNSSSDCSLEQTDAQTFTLQIHGARDRDSGEYYCSATPWLRSPAGTWTSGAELTSARAFLSVTFTMWDTLKLPLLYGVGAALVVGLLSVLLGFICAKLCCRNTKHTPRSRNGLMDLEMD